jgi:ABC-type Fe3+ transport system permease subunit
VLVVLVGVAVGHPAVVAAWRAAGWAWRGGGLSAIEPALVGWGAAALLGRTIVYAVLIGVIATALAWPAAWALRTLPRRSAWAALVMVPMLLPNYFAYAGWGLLRGPRTVVGDWLAGGPEWRLLLAGKAVAVVGLALWAWPLAALVLWPAARRVSGSMMDSLAADGAGRLARGAAVWAQVRGGAVASAGLVSLVMLGSLVPLDVAQVETYSIKLLLLLNRHPEPEAAWAGSWPLVGMMIAVAMAMPLGARQPREGDGDAYERTPSRVSPWRLSAGMVWAMSVVAPMVLFVLNLREPPDMPTLRTIARFSAGFWRDSGEALRSSAWIGLWVAILGALMTAAAWFGFSRSRGAGGVTRVCARVLIGSGLLPGVLVGSAISAAWVGETAGVGWLEWVGRGPAVVVLAHVARFGMVAAVAGWWLSRQESAEQRDLRRIDGAMGLRGWAGACAGAAWPGLIGAGLACGILSVHEIEASVQVRPPGVENLAQQLLDGLHYARDERLAAAAVNLMGLGIAAAWLAGWLVSRGSRSGGANEA